MQLLIAMLPLYLLGNLHCMGMCGPLVMMIGQHRYRYFYFLGRLLGFTAAGLIAGSAGALVNGVLQRFHIGAAAALLFGAVLVVLGVMQIGRWRLTLPGLGWANKRLAGLMLKDRPESTFLFGLATLLLPCGQSLIVFTACALSGSSLTGLINGAAFALLTSPSLFFAMQARRLLTKLRHRVDLITGALALLVGILSICRGLAEEEVIPHLVLAPKVHLVLY